jgi:hypothetical protein
MMIIHTTKHAANVRGNKVESPTPFIRAGQAGKTYACISGSISLFSQDLCKQQAAAAPVTPQSLRGIS